MKRIIIVFITIMIAMPLLMQAIVIGSDTAVSRETLATFPNTDTDNEMLGFAMFAGGFVLQDNTTTCTFNDFFPVSGIINLNGGTLTLAQDLILHNIINLQGLGNIVGGGYAMDLCYSVSSFPANANSFANIELTLNNDVTLNSVITFTGNCIISGCGQSLILSSSAAIIVGPGGTLQLRNIDLVGTQTNNVSCADDTGQLILNNVEWYQVADTFFTQGSISFLGEVDFLGSSTFYYTSDQTSTVAQNSQWRISDNLTLSIGKNSITLNNPLAFIDSSSILNLDNGTIAVAYPGLTLTKGTLIFDRNVGIDINSTNSGNGLQIGDGSISDDMILYFTPATLVSINSGHFLYDNVSFNSIQSPSVISQLQRASNSNMYIAQDFMLPSITIVPLTYFVPPIVVNPGVQFSYNNSKIILPNVEFNITSGQQGLFTFLLNGSTNYLELIRGPFPFPLVIEGTGSFISGIGTLAGPISFYNSAAQCNIDFSGYVGTTVTLNGGQLNLQNDLSFTASAMVAGPGTINLGSTTLILSPIATTWATPLTWQGSMGTLDMNAKLSLTSTWTISGSCVINGNGNTLDLSGGGVIVVEPNSALHFKNIRIQGIQGTNIRCVDDTGQVTLFDAQWEQSGDYSFDFGSMKFSRDNYLSGVYTFTYDSMQTSTVDSNSSVTIGDGMNFFTCRSSFGIEPLYFTDMTSAMEIDNSQFTVGPTGMLLTRGKLYANRDVIVEIQSTSTANGLQFGDGTPSDDMELYLNPGCTARYTGGHATMDITTSEPIISNSTTGQIIRSATSVFYLKNNTTLANVTVDVDPLSVLLMDPGVVLNYNNSDVVFSEGAFALTGIRYDAETSLLAGNNSINILDGVLPLVTLVQSTGNVLGGNGHVVAPIILTDVNTQLICGVNGFIYAPITLNSGTLTLVNDLNLANDVTLATSGTVQLNNCNVKIGKTDTAWSGAIDWDATFGGSVNLNAQVDLTGTWTFNGICDLRGSGNTLSLGAAGAIVVGPNSILSIYDMSLDGINDMNISCVDDTGVIILNDVTWKQGSNDYSFNYGALQFKNTVLMQGSGIFAYATDMTSTLQEETQLIFDTGFTFSYGPNSSAQNLLQFTDDTSQLLMNSATMYITGTGMVLSNGTLSVAGYCMLSVEDTPDGNGITFGNGIDDLFVEIGASAQLNVVQGVLSYNNMNLESWTMINYVSVLHMRDNTVLQLYESLENTPGTIQFDDKTTLARASGADIVGSIEVMGRLRYTILS